MTAQETVTTSMSFFINVGQLDKLRPIANRPAQVFTRRQNNSAKTFRN
jgi:hypothetical protein